MSYPSQRQPHKTRFHEQISVHFTHSYCTVRMADASNAVPNTIAISLGSRLTFFANKHLSALRSHASVHATRREQRRNARQGEGWSAGENPTNKLCAMNGSMSPQRWLRAHRLKGGTCPNFTCGATVNKHPSAGRGSGCQRCQHLSR